MCFSPQAEQQIVDILLRAQEVQYPTAWQDVESQAQNTQLYNVDLASSEVAELVAQVQSSGYHKILKVCCTILPVLCILASFRWKFASSRTMSKQY